MMLLQKARQSRKKMITVKRKVNLSSEQIFNECDRQLYKELVEKSITSTPKGSHRNKQKESFG